MYTIKCAHSRLSAPGHELLAGDGGARAGARGRPHATPQPHRSSAWTWRRTFSPPPPARGPTGLGAHLPPRAGPSVILGVWPPWGYGPAAQRTQTASNSKKEGLQKGHAQVCTRPPAVRKRTRLPRALAHNNARLCEAQLYAVWWVSGGSARSHLRRRGASLRLAAHHVRGHPAIRQPAPARACPVPSAGVPLARASGHPLVS